MTPLDAKLRRIEALRAENAADEHPSFVRIEAAARRAMYADPLGVEGTEMFVRTYPSLASMLTPFLVLAAFALGMLLAAMSHDPGCVAHPWDGNIETLLVTLRC